METETTIGKQHYIYGSIFYISNKLQALMDRILGKHGITTKQWLLTIILQEHFQSPPTLNEVTKVMGTSHQNVKQLALKLEEKGLLSLEPDDEDKRAIRLTLTEKSDNFWKSMEDESVLFLHSFFKDMTEKELRVMVSGFKKIADNLEDFKE